MPVSLSVPMSPTGALACTVFLIAISLYVHSRRKWQTRNPLGLPYPPGPRRLPLIGNVLDMPHPNEWLAVAEWCKQYGDLVFVENFGVPTVFINGYDAAVELLDKRSAIYSDRPVQVMLHELMGWDWSFTFMPYGERFKKHRAVLQRVFQQSAVRAFADIQALEVHKLLRSLTETPDDFFYHIRRTAGAIIMMIAYGHEVVERNDPFIALADDAIRNVSEAALPGTYLVDFIPWLKHVPEWLPGADFQRQAKAGRKYCHEVKYTPYEMTKEKIRNGAARPSMTSRLLEEHPTETTADKNLDENVIAGCAAMAYIGGADTTVSSILSFVLAATIDPEIQRRAHEEIDMVVGRDRLPTLDDRESMPYVEGIVKEALRWNPVAPLGVPHALMEDDIYNGYFIPKRTAVFFNTWAMLHDEKEYPEPMKFWPERWIPRPGKPAPRPVEKVAYGFGRRICPGRYLAGDTLFLEISSLLAAFNIEKALDTEGKTITPAIEYTTGFVNQPAPFRCSFRPRHPLVAQLIVEALEASGQGTLL